MGTSLLDQPLTEWVQRYRVTFGRDPSPEELRQESLAEELQHQLGQVRFDTHAPQATLEQAVTSPSQGPTSEAQRLSYLQTPEGTMSPRTHALNAALGVGRGIIGGVTFPLQAAKAAAQDLFAPPSPEEQRSPAYIAAMARAGQTVQPEVGPPAPTEPPATVELAKGLNPVPLLERINAGDEESLGELGGMFLGGALLHGATRASAVARGKELLDAADQAAKDAVARQQPGPSTTPEPLDEPTFLRRNPPPPSSRLPVPAPAPGDLDVPTFARRAASGTPGSSAPGMAELPPDLAATVDAVVRSIPRPSPTEEAAGLGGIDPSLLEEADAAAKRAVIVGYHGTPHEFDQFDISKVGSGEGAQAYGHGIYVAENPKVAETYRTAGRPPAFAGPAERQLANDALASATARGLNGQEARLAAIADLHQRMLAESNQATRFRFQDAVNNFDYLTRPETAGRVLQVGIRAAPEDFLDWEVPLGEQSPKVQAAVRELVGSNYRASWTGRDLYEALQRSPRGESVIEGLGSPAEASRALRDRGVAGIAYRDQASRVAPLTRQAKGIPITRNFVVFDDRNLQILRRAGKIDPRLLVGGAGAATGAAIGAAATPGDTKDKLLGALGGLGAGALLGLGAERLTRPAEPVAPVEPEGRFTPHVPYPTSSEPVGPATEHLNLDRMALTPEARAALEPQVQQAAEALGQGGKPVRTFDEAQARANVLATDPQKLMSIPASRLTGEERLALRTIVTQDANRAVEVANALHDPRTPLDARPDLEAELADIHQRTQSLLPKVVQAGTQQGRDLAYNRILAQQTMDPAFWLERAQRLLKDRPLTEEQHADIVRLTQAGNRQALADYVGKLARPKLVELAVGLGKTNLISALTTATKIVGTNAIELGRSVATAPIEVLADRILGTVSGERSRTFLGANLTDAAVRGVRGAFRDAAQIAKGQTPVVGPQGGELILNQRELNYVPQDAGAVGKAVGGTLNAYTHGVTRLHGMLHRATWEPAYQAALFEQARLLARREGAVDIAARAREIASDPTTYPGIFQRAVDAANRATFLDRSAASTLISGAAHQMLQSGTPLGQAGYVGVNLVAPFARISTNLVKAGAEYSPIGAVIAAGYDFPRWIKAMREGTPEGIQVAQRALVDRIGRTAPGTAAFLYGYLSYRNGTMTAGDPESPKERAIWEQRGMGPNAIKIGNQWRNVLVAGPLGLSAAFGAAYAQATAKATDLSGQASGAAVGALQAVTEESFLRGLEDFGNALHDPTGAGASFLRRTLAAWTIPNAVARAATAVDPAGLGRQAKTAGQTMASHLPRLREQLPPYRDAFGRPTRQPTDAGTVAVRLLDPSRPRANPSATDPVLAEISRVGALPGYAKQGPQETDNAYGRRVRAEGAVYRQVAQAALATPTYQGMPQLAQALVQQSPAYHGRNPAEVADELRAAYLGQLFAETRRRLEQGLPKGVDLSRRIVRALR